MLQVASTCRWLIALICFLTSAPSAMALVASPVDRFGPIGEVDFARLAEFVGGSLPLDQKATRTISLNRRKLVGAQVDGSNVQILEHVVYSVALVRLENNCKQRLCLTFIFKGDIAKENFWGAANLAAPITSGDIRVADGPEGYFFVPDDEEFGSKNGRLLILTDFGPVFQ